MDPNPNLQPSSCADLISGARSAVAITGAGISTSAGIPDFRGPNGLYVTRRYDPEKAFDIDWFFRDPRLFYEFSSDFIGLMKDTSPTFSHRVLAALEKEGTLSAVVTQNIDALHQAAGSKKVVELHGSYRSATCAGCGKSLKELTYDWWAGVMQGSPKSPLALCEACGGVLKPDIVFFGEPVLAMGDARMLVQRCDLLLVLGSSLQVMPASLLPNLTTATTVVINRGEVSISPTSKRYLVEADLDGYFNDVAACLGLKV
jgi:NAD-dependent deacetylase